jgi:hypothetical protein
VALSRGGVSLARPPLPPRSSFTRQAVGYARAHTLACHWPSSYTGKTSPDRVAIKAELVAGISEERWRFDFWGGRESTGDSMKILLDIGAGGVKLSRAS